MKTATQYEVIDRHGQAHYYTSLREAKIAAGGRNVWKIIDGEATLVR